jgi:hypothetical protein
LKRGIKNHGEKKMTIFDEFILKFGELEVAQKCKMNELPFLSDIKKFLLEKKNG